jgi:hypothetical protein
VQQIAALCCAIGGYLSAKVLWSTNFLPKDQKLSGGHPGLRWTRIEGNQRIAEVIQ